MRNVAGVGTSTGPKFLSKSISNLGAVVGNARVGAACTWFGMVTSFGGTSRLEDGNNGGTISKGEKWSRDDEADDGVAMLLKSPSSDGT